MTEQRPNGLTRRRVMVIGAAFAAGPVLAGANGRLVAAASARETFSWRGQALGAQSLIHLSGGTRSAAEQVMEKVWYEIDRLEDIFSLYRPNSELSRLNREGALHFPSADLIALMHNAVHMGDLTKGLFDVTIQPLWKHLTIGSGAKDIAEDRTGEACEKAAALVDYRKIAISESHIAFEQEGMAATLNGIAQGYISDRVRDLLQLHGYEHALVDLGEISSMKRAEGVKSWRVHLSSDFSPPEGFFIMTSGKAIATSVSVVAPKGSETLRRHIFQPSGQFAENTVRAACVIAADGATADALATTLCVMPISNAPDLLHKAGAEIAYVQLGSGFEQITPKIQT